MRRRVFWEITSKRMRRLFCNTLDTILRPLKRHTSQRKLLTKALTKDIKKENDYLSKDEKTVLKHFGIDPLLDVELKRVPPQVVDQVLTKDIKKENDYLSPDEKTVLKHFGEDPLKVELEHVPPSEVDAVLVRKVKNEQKRKQQREQKRKQQREQQQSVPQFQDPAPVDQQPSPPQDDKGGRPPVVDSGNNNSDQVRLLNEFRRVRNVEQGLERS